jgi:hypothetical protein
VSHAHILIHDSRRERLWAVARWTAFLVVPVLLAFLMAIPELALTALWYVLIPVLPATFFLSPALWRGICPLATLNELGNRIGTQRALSPKMAAVLGTAGLVLFHVMVPGRRVLFNQDGSALVITVALVGVLAVVLGAVWSVRSAFCNALCPVLPVELLYGHAPLVSLQRGRCTTCTVCTPRGCLDLSEQKTIFQVLGPARRTNAWLLTPFGIFIGALPGFVLGYSLLSDGPLATAGHVYLTTLGYSLLSYIVTVVLVMGLKLKVSKAILLLATAAGGLYYWFAGPAIATQLGVSESVSLAIRVVGIGVVAIWFVRTLRRHVAQGGI